MGDQGTNAIAALVLGSVVAVLLFIPVAAVQYRRDGRLGPADLTVLLFVPLGVLVRVITHRGAVVATALGFAVSLLIEVTQLTGVWGVYPCAYRLFDVDDLVTNTLGAALGAALSYPYAARRRRRLGTARRSLPTTVTAGRRLAATLSDVLFVVLAGTAAAALWRGYLVFAEHERPATDSPSMIALRAGVPLLIEGAFVLLAGKTVGELVVDLRTVPASTSRRLVKLVVGVVPLVTLAVVDTTVARLALGVLAVVAVTGAFLTRGHRGIANAAAGLSLEIDDS